MRALPGLMLLLCAPAAWSADWQVDHSASRLGFHTTQQDGRLDGEFESWSATIRFDPDHLPETLIEVTIDIASITTGSRQRDRYLPDPEWFHTALFPTATFRASGAEHLGDDRYLARGELTLRGITAPVELAFRWSGEGAAAEVHAETTLERTRFGVGAGEFAEADVVGLNVQVVADLELTIDRS